MGLYRDYLEIQGNGKDNSNTFEALGFRIGL